jgi:hypothetical protein
MKDATNRVPVYSVDEKLIGWYTPKRVEALLSTKRTNVIRARSGQVRRIYVLDGTRQATVNDYTGQRYSHNAESDHPNQLYKNVKNVWAFRYISRKDKHLFTSVRDSVMARAE